MSDDHNREIQRQHIIFLDVLYEYEGSRWPWVRWVAHKMHEEIMYRAATNKSRSLFMRDLMNRDPKA